MLVATTVAEIRNDLVNPSARLADILLKAKVLAYRLDVPEFKRWVDYELDGYAGTDVELPEYRDFPAFNYGTFSGFGGSLIHNQPIPLFNLPDLAQEHVGRLKLRQGVSALEDLGPSAEGGLVQLPWPPELTALVGQPGRIVQGYALSSAYQALSKSQIDGILGAIRNRLLTFMLELEDAFPELAESEEAAKDVPRDQATNIFYTHVYGSDNIVASGTHFTQVVQPSVSTRDLTGLLDYVRR